MEPAQECASCGNAVEGPSLARCETCKESSPDAGDGALCASCVSLHEKGTNGRGITRGHKFFSAGDSRADTMAAVLERTGLAALPTRCALHNKAIDIACTTCREPALCVRCFSKHDGHAIVVLAETAPAVRMTLRDAVFGTAVDSDTPGSTFEGDARASAQRIAAELDAFPGLVETAVHRIDALRDSVFAAASARHAAMRAQLEIKAGQAEAALTAELKACDDLQQKAAQVASDLEAAAIGLSDAEVVAYRDSLIARVARIRCAVVARSSTAPLVALEVEASEAPVLTAIAGLGSLRVEVACLDAWHCDHPGVPASAVSGGIAVGAEVCSQRCIVKVGLGGVGSRAQMVPDRAIDLSLPPNHAPLGAPRWRIPC